MEPTSLKIYGIKFETNDKRLMAILDDYEVPYVFFDYKDHPPDDEQLKKWAEFEGEDYPVNSRSTPFKKFERQFDKLPEPLKFEWLRKNGHVLIRPIIEDQDGNVLMMGGRPERIVKELCNIDV